MQGERKAMQTDYFGCGEARERASPHGPDVTGGSRGCKYHVRHTEHDEERFLDSDLTYRLGRRSRSELEWSECELSTGCSALR